MKTYIIPLLLICPTFIQAQQTLDTIYANDQKNVALFFPEPIRQGITGSENFVFTYNREKDQYFGLLQAKPGKESNLLIINRNGAIFSYIVSYREQLKKLNYFISRESSIGNEKPELIDIEGQLKSSRDIDNKTYYYQKFSSYLLDQQPFLARLKKRNKDIVLSIENIVFDSEELYFVIRIENRSTLDYDLNFLNFSVETRQKGKKKSLQSLYKEPLFVHNQPAKIAEGATSRMVYVTRKFSLSDDRRIILEMNENNGERNLKLKVSHNFINNPN